MFNPNKPGPRALAVLGASLSSVASPASSAQEPQRLPTKPAEARPLRRDIAIPSRLPGLVPGVVPRPGTASPVVEASPARRPTSPARSSLGRARPEASRAPSSTGPTPNVVEYGDLKTRVGETCVPPDPDQEVSFDFEGEIQDLVETISKVTCRNFILTNKVRSQKFKIVSPTPIKARNAWRVFLAALEANDFTVVPSGRYWKVIQSNDATRSPVPFYDVGESLRGPGETFPTDDQMVTKIYRVEHGGNPNNIVNYLNIFKSARGQVHPFPGTNLIVMTDYSSSLERLEKILEEIDQPDVLEKIHILPVRYASASEVAEKLTQIFEPQNAQARQAAGPKPTPQLAQLQARARAAQQQAQRPGQGADGQESSDGSVSKILADDRTNKLIVIASQAAYKQITALLRQLDVPGDISDGQIHVLRLKHADSEELASTLSSLAQGQPTRRPTPARRPGAPNQPAPPGGPSAAALFEGDVKVTADKATNSLVITASKSDLSSLRRVIDRLDVPRFQVFVEAAILEVSTSRDRNLGVGWHAGLPLEIGGETSPLIFANTPSQELSSLVNTINPLGLANLLGLATALRGPTLEGTEGLPGVPQGGIPSVGVVLQALQSSNDVNVVSTPHLLTMDNEEAEIQVNEKRPFPSGLTLGLGGLGGLAQAAGQNQGAAGALGNLAGLGLGQVSFNREDIGLTLKIKPQINDEDYVRLEIDQELSDVAGIDQVTNQVITSKRSAKTTVVVRSQDSVVIGGLVRDRETRDESKLPLLGDIPLVGWLFKRQNKTVEKVNLVLVLTPYIIRGPKDFRTIFERKMEERREFIDIFYGQTEEYRAQIDWDQKLGPLAAYRQTMRRELMKAENEGPGLPGQLIIRPGGVEDEEAIDEEDEGIPAPRPRGGGDAGGGGGEVPAEPLPPPEVLEGQPPPPPPVPVPPELPPPEEP